MPEAVIVDVVRTAGGKRNGALSGWHPVDLAAETLKALAERTGVDPEQIDDVIMGCVMQAGAQALNVGRNAVLAAGWPESVPSTTIDRQCGSSQQAAHFAALSCEACHIPHAAAPAVESIDWTVPSPQGEPRVTWRGIEGDAGDRRALVTGFRPVLLPRLGADGRLRLVPCNLITAAYWIESGPAPRPVRLPDLEKAVAGGAADRRAVRAALVAQGYVNPLVRTEVQPHEMHHGVVGGRWATRSCDACHSAGSVLNQPMTLAAALPARTAPDPGNSPLTFR